MRHGGLYRRLKMRPLATSRARLLAASALAAVAIAPVVPALAQVANPLLQQFDTVGGGAGPSQAGQAEGQMLLEADELVYDFDAETVTAVGNVQVNYGGVVLDAERLTYYQRSGRLIASGDVRMLEPNGNLITAETLDITDDMRDGFIGSLNLVTIDRTRFAAQSAERRDNNLTIFRRGVYTACEPCLEHPERPPLWQVKAARIIHDSAEKTVYYEHARLEFFGVPVAYLPAFSHPDPTVTRKSGFLVPTLVQTEAIGVGLTTPYFWNLAPHYDLTLSPTYLTRQGLLAQAEWRHRLMNGAYSIRLAGIFQADKDVFVGTSGYEDLRGSVQTTGSFLIDERWSYGWDLHGSSDRTFNRDYRIPGAEAQDLTSTAYLTGLSDRNFFDLRGYHFSVQRENRIVDLPDDGDPDTPDFVVHDDQAEQAIVHPVIDHNYVLDYSVLGGEVQFDSNLTSLTRDESDPLERPDLFDDFYAGVAGHSTRATTRASWERRFIAPGGQVLTPFSYLQADARAVSLDEPAFASLDTPELLPRAMPAAGVDYEWPILATLGSSAHTFGPRAQLIVRPDEQHIDDLPNEDAQSLIFEDTNLFEWDKFTGYDRQEGGTRANVGLVYQGLFPNGASVDALIGQSFQVAGDNSFAEQDHALTGLGSGLESDASDYVGRVTLNTGAGVTLTARGRFDEESLDVNRGELNAVGAYGGNVASLGYAYVREGAGAGIFEERQEISGAAAVEITENWSVLGSAVYDLEFESRVTQNLGLSYADECFEISAVYSETTDVYSDLVSNRQIFLRIDLRTIGGYGVTRPVNLRSETATQ